VLKRSGAGPRAACLQQLTDGIELAIAGYAYLKGTVLTDPSLPLENVSNEAHVGVFAYATTLNVLGKSAKFDMIVSYTSLAAEGLVFGQPHARFVNGFADPRFVSR
jgi:hypothetical protein